jgi:hypothetical protein
LKAGTWPIHRDWKFSSKSILKISNPKRHGTGLGIFFKIDPWNQEIRSEMERDWEFSSKSIHKIRKSEAKWNGIGNFLQNRSMESGNSKQNGTGFAISLKIDV